MTKFLAVPPTLVSSLVLLAIVLAPSCIAQSAVPASDPQALSLATQSIAAMTGGISMTDVTLLASVTWIAGSGNQTGTGTLAAKGSGRSRVDLALNGGPRKDIRSDGDGTCAWAGADGAVHENAPHNCLTDASWFFVPLSSLSTAAIDPTVILTYVGKEEHGGVSVQHLHARVYIENEPSREQLSGMDFYLDQASLLPLALGFDVHPDEDASINIPVEVRFSDYQPLGGIQVPSHIQRLFNGTVALDIVVTSAVVNSGIPDSNFSLQ